MATEHVPARTLHPVTGMRRVERSTIRTMRKSLGRRLTSRFRKMDVAPRPDVDTLAFDVSGWQERERSPGWIVWTNEAGDALSAAVAPRRGFPSLSDREALTKYGRTFAESQGGSIVSMDTFLEGTVELAQCVYKRQRGSGYAYTAMIW